MSGLFGGGGGSKGSPQNVNIPPFESQGGVTQQQADLGQYTLGQDLMAQASLFGGSGTGQSTMATQGAQGAHRTEAQQMAGMSDANQGAEYQLYQNDVQAQQQDLANQVALNQSNSPNLSSLASAAGLSSSGVFGGGTSGNFGTATA